jgi:hypothetical protein
MAGGVGSVAPGGPPTGSNGLGTHAGGAAELGSLSPLSYFNIGMIIEVLMLHNRLLRGEVVAFDMPSRMLAIKCASTNGKTALPTHNVQIVNLQYVTSIKLINDCPLLSPPPLPNLNFSKLNVRMIQNVEEKRKRMGYTGVNVSPTAQRLVHAITKTIQEVRWEGQQIVVLDQVTISPPYAVEDCRLNANKNTNNQPHALQHVQKLVGKFHKENGTADSA